MGWVRCTSNGLGVSLLNNYMIGYSNTQKTPRNIDANNYVTVTGDTITLHRNSSSYGLWVYTPLLKAGKEYTILFQSFSGSDGNFYCDYTTNISTDPVTTTRWGTASTNATQGVTITPSVDGYYGLMLWSGSTYDITITAPLLIDTSQILPVLEEGTYVATTHPISCGRTGATDFSVTIASFTTTTNGKVTISVTGLTDCGSNEGYIALLKNDVEQERGTLTTDVSTTIDFQPLTTSKDDTISIKFGWANNHTASFNGTYTCNSIGTAIPMFKVHSGKVNVRNGNIVADNDYCYTDFIDFNNGYQMFDLGETSSSDYIGIAWYRTDGTYGGDYWAASGRYRYVNNSSYYNNGIRKQRLTFRKAMLDKVILFDQTTNITYTVNPIKLVE